MLRVKNVRKAILYIIHFLNEPLSALEHFVELIKPSNFNTIIFKRFNNLK